jgi:hypothetical protein
MSKFDESKDQKFAVIEAVVDPEGNVLAHGPSVAQPEDSSHTRYRFTVAAYNGNPLRLRVQTVYTRKSDGAERVSGCSSWLIAHGAGKLPEIVQSLCQQAKAANLAAKVRKAS